MTTQKAPSHATIMTALNAMPVSRHVQKLFKQEKAPFSSDHLALINLMEWAAENHYQDWHLGQQELGALIGAAQIDPQAVHDNLTDERILQAQNLAKASAVLVSRVGELFGE